MPKDCILDSYVIEMSLILNCLILTSYLPNKNRGGASKSASVFAFWSCWISQSCLSMLMWRASHQFITRLIIAKWKMGILYPKQIYYSTLLEWNETGAEIVLCKLNLLPFNSFSSHVPTKSNEENHNYYQGPRSCHWVQATSFSKANYHLEKRRQSIKRE